MQNIQISQSKQQKRSVQSLIEDSAIDNQPSVINFQILELKKAYNQTCKSFNTKIQALQSQIEKYKQKCKKLEEANISLAEKCYEFQKRKDQCNQMRLYCEKMKRKVLYIQSKYEKLMENRSLVQQGYEDANKHQQRQSYEKTTATYADSIFHNKSKADKNEIYKEISDLISAKVKQFTKQLRLQSMTKQLQMKIESFLEQLIYITPISGTEGTRFSGVRQNEKAKKENKEQENILLSQQKAWKQISRKIDNTKEAIHERSITPLKRQNLFNQQQGRKTGTKTRSPLAPYANDDYQQREYDYRPSPRKTKIFPSQ